MKSFDFFFFKFCLVQNMIICPFFFLVKISISQKVNFNLSFGPLLFLRSWDIVWMSAFLPL